MKKEDLIALGLTEEQADAMVSKYGNMLPKERFDEVNNAKKALETQVQGYESQLKELQDKATGNETLQAEIQSLRDAQTQLTQQYDTQLKEERLNNALKTSLLGKVHDADLVLSQLDRSIIQLDDNGSIKGGLDEQVTALKESKGFLFIAEQQAPPTPTFKGWNPVQQQKQPEGQAPTFVDQLAGIISGTTGNTNTAPDPWGK